jgi:hypothetical protein
MIPYSVTLLCACACIAPIAEVTMAAFASRLKCRVQLILCSFVVGFVDSELFLKCDRIPASL